MLAVRPSVGGSVVSRAVMVAAIGLAVGIGTSYGQTYFASPWSSLVNAASPWLSVMFAAGAMWRSLRAAALAGLVTGLLILAGYYGTSMARGFPESHAFIAFWAGCAIAGGPVFGMAGWSWWRGRMPVRGLGASALPAAFFAEATVSYGWHLHYWASAALFGVAGLVAFAVVGLRGYRHRDLVVWLLTDYLIAVVVVAVVDIVASHSL